MTDPRNWNGVSAWVRLCETVNVSMATEESDEALAARLNEHLGALGRRMRPSHAVGLPYPATAADVTAIRAAHEEWLAERGLPTRR